MPVFRRRAHYRVDDRTGRRVLVRAHTVTTDGTDPGIDDDRAAALRTQAALLGDYLGPQPEGERRSISDMVEGYTVEASSLTATGHRPGRWWDAQDTLIDGDDAEAVVQMPERYSPSSDWSGRRTHRIQYQFGATKVRMPSRAAIGRFMNDNPALTEFEVPVEALTGNRRGMGFVRMRKDERTGLWKITGGSGGFAGDSEFAQATRQNLDGIANRRRPRPTRRQAQTAAQAAVAVSAGANTHAGVGTNVYGLNRERVIPGDRVLIENNDPATVIAVGTDIHTSGHVRQIADPDYWQGRVLVERDGGAHIVVHVDALAPPLNPEPVDDPSDPLTEALAADDIPYTGPAPAETEGPSHCDQCGQFIGGTRGHMCPTRWTRPSGSEVSVSYVPDTGMMRVVDDDMGSSVAAVTRDEYRIITEAGDDARDLIEAIVERDARPLDDQGRIRPRFPINRDGIQSVGYDPDTRTLRVKRFGGVNLHYTGVGAGTWGQLRGSENPAEFIGTHIRGHHDTVTPDWVAVSIERRMQRYSPTEVPLSPPTGDTASDPGRVIGVWASSQGTTIETAAGERSVFRTLPSEVLIRLATSDDPTGVYNTEVVGHHEPSPSAYRPGSQVPCSTCGVRESPHTCLGPGHRSRSQPTAVSFSNDHALAAARYSPHQTTIRGRFRDGNQFDVTSVTGEEFAQFIASPTVTLAAWRAGRRITEPGEHPALSTIHLHGVNEGRDVRQASRFLNMYEYLSMPGRTRVQQALRDSADGFIHVPVNGQLQVANDTEQNIDSVPFSGHVRVTRVRGTGFVVTDDGLLTAPDGQGRAVTEAVAATLNGRRARGAFQEGREAAHAASTFLAGRAEAARQAAQAERERREEADRIAREEAARTRAEREAAAVAAREQSARTAAELAARYQSVPSITWGTDNTRFQEVYEQTRAKVAAGENPVPYMRENALDGLATRESGRGFGVELEFKFPGNVDRSAARQAILRDMAAAGLLDPNTSPRWMGYMEQRNVGYNHWKCTEDGTVDGEIVSPVLFDEPEAWDQLEKVCEIVRRHGGVATIGQVGSHVHVGCGDYDETPENHTRLLANVAAAGDDLYRVAANRDRGSHRGTQWCRPNQPIPAAGYSRVEEARRHNSSHTIGMNFESVTGERGDHVEFRMWDGSLDPATIQTQVKLSVGLVAASLAGREVPPEAARPVGSARAANPTGRRLTGEEWDAQSEPFRKVLDTLFTRDIDKAQVTAAWAASRWTDR